MPTDAINPAPTRIRSRFAHVVPYLLPILSLLLPIAYGLYWITAAQRDPSNRIIFQPAPHTFIIADARRVQVDHWPVGFISAPTRPGTFFSFAGVRYESFVSAAGTHRRNFSIHHEHLLALSLLPLLSLLVHRWRSAMQRRKQPTDHCRHCGYDLRASPTRCPECGTPKLIQDR